MGISEATSTEVTEVIETSLEHPVIGSVSYSSERGVKGESGLSNPGTAGRGAIANFGSAFRSVRTGEGDRRPLPLNWVECSSSSSSASREIGLPRVVLRDFRPAGTGAAFGVSDFARFVSFILPLGWLPALPSATRVDRFLFLGGCLLALEKKSVSFLWSAESISKTRYGGRR